MNNNTIQLYHTSSQKIDSPDVNHGMRNADFGRGFYLSDNIEFSKKWASERNSYINCYTFDMTGLTVKRFEHSEEWLEYITKNRAGYEDAFADVDVIIGPIANDTLYDTYGIITSGLIKSSDALKLLKVGKKYCQINIKSQKAASQLKWESVQILTPEEISESRKNVRNEESEFRNAFLQTLTELENYEEIEEILS